MHEQIDRSDGSSPILRFCGAGPGQETGRLFRPTHHLTILENWGGLWMAHSLFSLSLTLPSSPAPNRLARYFRGKRAWSTTRTTEPPLPPSPPSGPANGLNFSRRMEARLVLQAHAIGRINNHDALLRRRLKVFATSAVPPLYRLYVRARTRQGPHPA